MKEFLNTFPEQFLFDPEIMNASRFQKRDKYIVAGMGGSHLAADLIKARNPEREIIIHSDYGLPPLLPGALEHYFIIVSSYSGNTEEVIDAFTTARARVLPVGVIADGGALLDLAKKYEVPYIDLPQSGLQPRLALGYSLRAFLAFLGDAAGLDETRALANTLKPALYEERGKALAEFLRGSTPVVYASRRNRAVAYNWKVKLNETGKIPAFYNEFPELNHNEMTGFALSQFSKQFYFIFLEDDADDPRIVKRMRVTETMLEKRGYKIAVAKLEGATEFQKIFSSLLLADWAAYYAAGTHGFEPLAVPMVEEFKKLIQQ